LIDQAYEALRESVYQALALQTRLASYLNVVELSIDENGIHFDTAPMAQMLAAKHSTNLQTGIEDLAELVRYAQPTLAAVGYDGLGTLRQWVEALPPSSPLLAQLQADGLFTYGAGLQASSGTDVFLGNASANQVNGGAGNDVLDGGAGNDYLYGGDGDDVVRGGADSDTLYGDNGNDTLDGGAGNDTLYGGIGSDTYLFGRGSGADMVSDVDSTAGNTDVLSIGSGVTADQLWFRRVGADLEVSIIGAGDKTTISGWYSGSAYHVEQFKTADGQLLLDTQVDALVAAMASFAPPAAGQTVLPADYQTALNPVIAANWK
jgi:Ca2+-binding RTX toxin-like protein